MLRLSKTREKEKKKERPHWTGPNFHNLIPIEVVIRREVSRSVAVATMQNETHTERERE